MAASAMMILASCSKTEVVYQDQDPQEIGFFSIVKKQTKAAIPDDKFTYSNMVVAASISDSDAIAAGLYFGKTVFTKNDGVFTGGKYWPIQPATLDFLAVAPEVEDQVETSFTNGAASATVVVTDNETNQHDVMYATAEARKVANVTPGAVPMVFNHALAWVNFTFAGNNSNITITDVAVTASYNGTLTIDNSGDAISASWTEKENAKLISVDAEDLNINTTAAAPYGAGLLVVPNTGVNFVITYRVTDTDQVSHEYTYTYTLTDNWEVRKKYTYNVTMNVNEIQITPTVDTWSEETPDPEVDINK